MMKRALLVVLATAAGCSNPPPQQPANLLDSTFTTADGKTVKLSDYRGKKAVVLLFQRGYAGKFACTFCGLQTRAYKESYEKVKAAGAEVLMVLPGATDAKGYLRKIGESDDEHPDANFAVPYPVLLDTDFSASKQFNVAISTNAKAPFPVSKPATIVIVKNGSVVWEYHGKNPQDRPTVDVVLEVLKTGKAPATEESKETAPEGTLAWVAYEAGMKESREKKKPVLLDFYADW